MCFNCAILIARLVIFVSFFWDMRALLSRDNNSVRVSLTMSRNMPRRELSLVILYYIVPSLAQFPLKRIHKLSRI